MTYSHNIFGGPVELVVVKNDKITKIAEVEHNLTVYSGYDILGKLLAGKSEYSLGAVYIQFSNDAVPTLPTPALTDDISAFTGLSGNDDYIRQPLTVSPTLEASDSSYSSNKLTIFAATTATVGENGLNFSSSAGSSVVGGALVATPSSDPADDILYARFALSSAVAVGATGDFGFRWYTQITES